MKICCCSLAGTDVCLTCSENDGVVDNSFINTEFTYEKTLISKSTDCVQLHFTKEQLDKLQDMCSTAYSSLLEELGDTKYFMKRNRERKPSELRDVRYESYKGIAKRLEKDKEIYDQILDIVYMDKIK